MHAHTHTHTRALWRLPTHALSLRRAKLYPLDHNQIAAGHLDAPTRCVVVHALLDVLNVGGENVIWNAIADGAFAILACGPIEANRQGIVVVQRPAGEA